MMTLTISTDLITIASGSPAPQTDAALPDAAPAPDVRLRFEQLLRQRASLQDEPASQLQPGADGGERASLSAERSRPWPAAAPQSETAMPSAAAPCPPSRPDGEASGQTGASVTTAPVSTAAASSNVPMTPFVTAPDEPLVVAAPQNAPQAAELPVMDKVSEAPSKACGSPVTPDAPLDAPPWPVAESVVAVASSEGKPAVDQPVQRKAAPAVKRPPLAPPSGDVSALRPLAPPSVQQPSVPSVAEPSAAVPGLQEPSAPVAVVSGAWSVEVQPAVAERERPLAAMSSSSGASSVLGVAQPWEAPSGASAVEPSAAGLVVAPPPAPSSEGPVAVPPAPSSEVPVAVPPLPLSGAIAVSAAEAERTQAWGDMPVVVEGERQTLWLSSEPTLVRAFPLSDAESAEEPGGTVGQQQAVVLVCQAWLTPLLPQTQAVGEVPAAPSRRSVSVFGDASQPLPFAVRDGMSEEGGLPLLTAYVLTSRGSVCETRLPLVQAEALLARLAPAVQAGEGVSVGRAPSSSSAPSFSLAGASWRRQPVLLLVASPETPMTLADVQGIAAETLPRLAELAAAAVAPQAAPTVPRAESLSPRAAQVATPAPEAAARADVQPRQPVSGGMPARTDVAAPSSERVVRRQAWSGESGAGERAGERRPASPSVSQVAAGAPPSPEVVTVDLRSPVAPLLSRAMSDASRAALLLQVADGVAEAVVMRPSLMWGEGEVSVRLSPDVLGGTEIRLRVSDGGLLVQLTPSAEVVTAQLQAAQPQLQAWLSERLAVYQQRIRVEVRSASREERDA